MKRLFPVLLLLLLPCLLFPNALPGDGVVSADDHLSVHHAFQDVAGGKVMHPHLSDPALQFAGLRRRVVEALRAGEAPLWNPDIWTGAPLLGDGQSMVGSPVTWLHTVFEPDTAQDLAVVWVLLWTALGTALLAGRLGMGRWAACTAGAAAMTAPFTHVWLLHPHAATFAWLPWVVWGAERRHVLPLCVAVAGLVAGGHPQTAAHSLAIALVWVVLRKRWWVFVKALPVGLCLSAPIWLPFAEEVMRSASVAAHGGNQLAPAQLLDLAWPGWHGHPARETWSHREWSWADGRLHPGLGVALLTLVAVVRRQVLARGLVAGWIFCLIVAVVGFVGPINHARLGSLAAWLLALTAGLGVQALSMRWRAVAMLFVMCTGAWVVHGDQGSLDAQAHAPAPAEWTQRLRAEIGCAPGQSSGPGCGRVLGLGWALQPNTGALAGLPDVRGYDLPVSVDTERLMGALRSPPSRPWFALERLPSVNLLHWMGVRAVVSTQPLARGEPLDLGLSPLHAARVSGASTRAWVATAPTAVDTPEDAIGRLLDADRAQPPVEHLPGRWPKTGRMYPASWVVDSPGELVLETQAPEKGLLVIADAWHPGWKASVDDVPVPCLRVGGVFRGVVISPGVHTVRLVFEPWGWRVGGLLGLLGVFLLVVLTLRTILWRR